jgi:hypothetical protein
MGRGWFICGGSGKDTVPRPPLRESEGDEVSVKPAAAADEDAPAAEDGAPPDSEAARESEFEIWSGDPDEIVAASRKSWPPSEAKREEGTSEVKRKSWPSEGGAPPGAEGTSPVNAYWWTRKVLAENEVDLDDDHDLEDSKSRI